MSLSSSSQDEYANIPTFPVKVVYESADVPIPDDFLSVTSPPLDAKPITITPVDFSTLLPQYNGKFAVVLDNVISPSECEQLIRMCEASVPNHMMFEYKSSAAGRAPVKRPWRPAMVSLGGEYEVLNRKYRRGERIVWDHQEITDRLWARCAQAPGLLDQLATVDDYGTPCPPHHSVPQNSVEWQFLRINKRMRFLKYTPGDFFKPHIDGPYVEPVSGNFRQTMITLHLYLNDSQAEVGDAAQLVGGATSFLSQCRSVKLDVNPRSGRILIFQHSDLLHSGDDVAAGVKYTMRTDLMYECREDRRP